MVRAERLKRFAKALGTRIAAGLVPVLAAGLAITLLVGGSRDAEEMAVKGVVLAVMLVIFVRFYAALRENSSLLGRLQEDDLTGIANRSKLVVDLRRAFARSGRQPSLLAIFDLDGFKGYNDSFGHPAGDALLVRLAGKFEDALAPVGHAYRLGGDEFAAIVEGGDRAAHGMVGTAAAALTESGHSFEVGCSFGVVEIPREVADPSAAIQLADARLYDHKDSRRPDAGQEVEDVLVRIVHHRAPELSEHGRSVAEHAVAVGERLGLGRTALRSLERAAELHDVGKIAIPDAILAKEGALSEEEWQFMHQHTILGERIVAGARSLATLGPIIRATHERWDGKGYPDGLAGERIPLAARIIFAVDAFDAMTSMRPYARAMPPEGAIAELQRCAGTQFDPAVVEAFCAVRTERSSAAVQPPGPHPATIDRPLAGATPATEHRVAAS